MAGQVFGDVARMQFRASVDREAVALDDNREFHGSGVADGSAGVESSAVADVRAELAKLYLTTDRESKAEAMYKPVWEAGKIVLEGKPGQTELTLVSASATSGMRTAEAM